MKFWDSIKDRVARYIIERYDFKSPPHWLKNYGTNSVSGLPINSESSLKFSAYFAPLVIKMGTASILPKQIRIKTEKGSRLYPQHDQAILLSKRPNPLQTSSVFWSEFVFNQNQEGNGLFWMEGVGSMNGRPTAWWNIKKAEPEFQDGDLFIRVNQKLPNGKQLDGAIPYREFVHVPNVIGSKDEKGFIWGRPTHFFAADTIGLGKAAENISSLYMNKQGSLFRYLTTDKDLNKPQKELLKDSLSEYKPGGKRQGEIPLFDMGLKMQELGMSVSDIDPIQTRTRAIEDGARFQTFPALNKIGHMERMNFANAYNASQEYRETTVLPIIEPIIDELNYKILLPSEFSSGEVYVHFESKKLLQADPKTRMEFYKGLAQIGSLSPNKALDLEDMDQLGPEGDLTYIMANMIPTTKAEAYWDAIIKRALSGMTPEKAMELINNSNGVH